MKKKTYQFLLKAAAIFVAVFLLLATVILPLAAIAEGVSPEQADSLAENVHVEETATAGLKSPFTWSYLATIAGATAATLLIAQFTKMPLDRVWKIPTRALVYVIAFLILFLAQLFTGGMTVDKFVLTAVNAFVVALAAYGSYELTFAKIERKY